MAAGEPKHLALARKEIGTKEWAGAASNPVVVGYFKDAVKKAMPDAVPWCAAFVGAMLARAGHKPSGSLMARSYATWGRKTTPVPGAIAVWPRGRPPSGHVNIVSRVAGGYVWCIGGNQKDAVNEQRYRVNDAIGFRLPT